VPPQELAPGCLLTIFLWTVVVAVAATALFWQFFRDAGNHASAPPTAVTTHSTAPTTTVGTTPKGYQFQMSGSVAVTDHGFDAGTTKYDYWGVVCGDVVGGDWRIWEVVHRPDIGYNTFAPDNPSAHPHHTAFDTSGHATGYVTMLGNYPVTWDETVLTIAPPDSPTTVSALIPVYSFGPTRQTTTATAAIIPVDGTIATCD